MDSLCCAKEFIFVYIYIYIQQALFGIEIMIFFGKLNKLNTYINWYMIHNNLYKLINYDMLKCDIT